jgi:prepilin-type N-terminal cleavage/methylation domain-containing protein
MQILMHDTRRSGVAGRRGFTSVELIVVMAVLLVLAGILFPTKGGAKHRAQRIACLSNLKHVGLAFMVFAHDNEELFPTHEWRKQAVLIGRVRTRVRSSQSCRTTW